MIQIGYNWIQLDSISEVTAYGLMDNVSIIHLWVALETAAANKIPDVIASIRST